MALQKGSIYKLEVYNRSAARQAVITDFEHVAATKRVNSPGILTFGLRGDHAILSSIEDKWLFELWRRPEPKEEATALEDWDLEGSYLYRDAKWQYPESGSTFVGIAEDVKACLGWREIAYPAATVNRSFFNGVVAETICKTLVDYNISNNATVGNGRDRGGDLVWPAISVAADSAGGSSLVWYCAYKNLLEQLQRLAEAGGGDWELNKSSPGAYEFEFYAGQLGSDLSGSIEFSMERGNMANPVYNERRKAEATVAIVGGQGERDAREVEVRTGPNYNASYNDIEKFVNATDVDFGDTVGLQDRGDEKLEGLAAKFEFEFDVLQTPATRYGVDYELGDLVTALNPYTGSSFTAKVEAVTMAWARAGEEHITIEVREQ